MIRKTLAATTLALTALAALPAAADIVTKMSPHSVPDTIDRLEAAVTEAGAMVFARVDHAEGATKVDMELRPTTLLIFGNPKLGTPAMLDGQTAGLDLPMRVLAYADDSGMVHVSYHDPA
ncbi:MAG TPA: camphor resistance protein CrcB, partial [Sulfitobacter sp.]|nr:camphor resistance protein CrcB [Sulfitobacter sp.]